MKRREKPFYIPFLSSMGKKQSYCEVERCDLDPGLLPKSHSISGNRPLDMISGLSLNSRAQPIPSHEKMGKGKKLDGKKRRRRERR